MTRKCIVPKCKSGYASNKERVSLFHVPKDPELRAKWINVIPPTKLVITTSHAVCEKHFTPSDIQRNYIHKDAYGKIIANVAYQLPRLSKTAVPSIFPSLDQQKQRGVLVTTKCSAGNESDIPHSDQPSVSHEQTVITIADECPVDETMTISDQSSATNIATNLKTSIDSNIEETECAIDGHESWESTEAMEIDESIPNESAAETISAQTDLDEPPEQIVDANDFEECSDVTSTSDHLTTAANDQTEQTDDPVTSEPTFQDLFDDLFDNPDAVPIPVGWFRYTSARTKKWIAFSTFDTKIESPTSVHPLPRRSIVLTQDGDVQTSANGKTFPHRNLCRSIEQVRTRSDLSRLLTTLSRVELCNGIRLTGQALTQRPGLQQDHFGEWRNQNCTIISNSRICSACQRSKKSINQRKRRQAKQQQRNDNKKKSDVSYRNLDEKSKSIVLLKRLRSQKAVVRRARERTKKFKNEISLAQNRIGRTNEQFILDKCKKLNLPQTQQMCIREMIAAAGKKSSTGNRYAEDWIMSCLLMHIRSPGHYRFLQKNDILPVPSPRTIRRYMSVVNFHCGFDENFFASLKKRLEAMPESHRRGVLRVDEMTSREAAVCSSSLTCKISNDHRKNGDEGGGTHGLVMIFTALVDDYHQPVAVFAFKEPVAAEELTKIVVKAIILLDNAGAKVHAVVSDVFTGNRDFWTELGGCGKMENCRTAFTHPCDETEKIFFLADFRRLVTNVRDRLLDKRELVVNPEASPVKWSYFEALYEEERKMSVENRMCEEITEKHVILNTTTRTDVRLATQIFSNSVAKGLIYYQEIDAETFDDCGSTIEFCRMINDVLEALDVKSPNIGVTPDGDELEILKTFLWWLNDWESQLEKGLISEDQFLSRETAEALRMTVQSTIDMCNYLCEKFEFTDLLTGKINHGSLEKLFETIRHPAGDDHSITPTFLQLYKLLSIHSILKPPVSGSCTVVDQQTP